MKNNRQHQQFSLKPIAAMVLLTMAGSSAQAEQGTALEEIIVTAQKQVQMVQDVPISIEAFGAKALENANVTNLSDLRSLTASVDIKPYPVTSEALVVSIRGVPIPNISIYNDPAVAIHIDGVYIARSTGLNLTVADLESVEVLKGPQGTLYGRNAVAGVINLNTARPTQDFGFMQNVTVGNYGKLTSKTSVNVPLTDTLAAKVAYIHDERDGYIKDSNGSGKTWGSRKAEAGRVDFRWRPADRVTVDYGYDWNKVAFQDSIAQCLNQTDSHTGLTVSNAFLYPYTCTTQRLSSLPMANGSNGRFAAPESHTENTGHTLKVEWDVSSTLTLRSITGVRELKDNSYGPHIIGLSEASSVNIPGVVINAATNMPTGAMALTAATQPLSTNDKYLSQELVLLGKPSEYFKYTAGFYYFDEKGSFSNRPGASHWVGPVQLYSNGAGGTAHNSSWALFGQASWTPDVLGRKLDIIPGIRYTRDKRDATLFTNGSDTYIVGGAGPGTILYVPQFLTGGPVINAAGSNSFSRTSPGLTVQYHINNDMMVYGKVLKGYRSGGYNDLASSQARFAAGYAPETLTSTEMGFKGEFLDRRVRANLALFQSKYKDQIVTLPTTIISKYDVYNAGSSTFTGHEVELLAAVTDALRVGFNWTHVNFRFDKVLDPASGINVTDYFHMLPIKNSYNLSLDYNFGKVGPGRLALHMDYAHADKTHIGFTDRYNATTGALIARQSADNYTTPAYGLWNARVAMSGIPVGPGNQGDLTVGLWVKNLTDKKYANFAADYSNYGLPVGSASRWGDPRTVGIDLTYRY